MTMDKTLAIIREAISIEKYGYDFYYLLRDQISDRRGQTVISYLARLEAEHVMQLETEYFKQIQSLEEMDEGQAEPLRLMAIEEIFVVEGLPEIYQGSDHVKALEFAVQVEIKSVDFYTKAMEHSEAPALKDLFRRLADFEREHIAFIEHNIETLKENKLWSSDMAGELHG